MRFSLRFALVLLVPVLAIQTVNGALRVRRELSQMTKDAQVRAVDVGVVIISAPPDAVRAAALRVDAAVPDLDVVVWSGAELDAAPCLTAAERDGLLHRHVREPRRCDDGQVRAYYPVSSGDEAVEVTVDMGPRRQYVVGTVVRVLVVELLLVLSAVAAALVFGRFFFGRRIEALAEAARRFGAGDPAVVFDTGGNDEISELAKRLQTTSQQLVQAQRSALDDAAARLATMGQLRHADRLVTVGQLSAGLAHELATPLNVAIARAQSIADGGLDDTEVHRAAVSVVAQGERMTRIIRQLLDFARPRRARRVDVDVVAVVTRALDLLQPMARKSGVVIEGPMPMAGSAMVDSERLEQVVVNLAVNAIQAMPAGGTLGVDVVAAVHPERGGRWLQIAVTDTGVGIAAENIDRLFDPFFTTKDVGSGTGLGLSIVHGIVREHEGFIEVTSRPQYGTTFRVWLPEQSDKPAAQAAGERTEGT